jgi:hypothetical protein
LFLFHSFHLKKKAFRSLLWKPLLCSCQNNAFLWIEHWTNGKR